MERKLERRTSEKAKGTTTPGGIKAELWETKAYLSEISQPTGMEFAFLSPGNKQCHPWVRCRDFLNDALRSQVIGKRDSIYGFIFDPATNPPIDLGKMRMLVRRKSSEERASENTKEMMESALAIIHCVEAESDIKPLTEMTRISNGKDIYLFEGSPDWVESTFMISLYTFLIRLGAKKLVFKSKEELLTALKKIAAKEVGYEDNDISYLQSVREYIFAIAKARKSLNYVGTKGENLFREKSIGTFHNYTGIVALCNEAIRKKKKQKASVGLEDLVSLSANIVE